MTSPKKVSFSGGLLIETVNDVSAIIRREWEVTIDGVTYIIPVGFKTDFMSSPTRSLLGNVQRWAVLHDYLYKMNGLPRRHADFLMRRAMRLCGVNPVLCWTVWLAVRCFGWHAWGQHRRAESHKEEKEKTV